MTNNRPRVVLADDYPAIITALQRLLAPSCDIVGHVGSGTELLKAVEALSPDVVIADVRLPDLSGLEACRAIHQSMPQTKVIVLSADDDPEVRKRALEVGASAFVRKHQVGDDLELAIQQAFDGSSRNG
jgi:two-component system, NarL family, nitrate/nitrite response regulator NarL